MSKHTIRLGAIALTAAGALATAGGVAGAASASTTPATLSGIQAKAAAAITLRMNDLNAAIAKVNAAKGLGAGQSTLAAYLSRDIAPLQQLGTKIVGDTLLSQAESDYQSIFTDYRVLALVLPAAAQAADADHVINTAVPGLTADASKAQSYVNATNQATLQPMIDSLNADISGATNGASGVAGTVLSYVPSQWNANNSLLSPTKASLATADGDVKNARSEVQQIKQYLESSRPAVKSAPTTPTTAPANAGG